MDLAENEKELLKNSWNEISKVGVPQIGLLLLQRLFQVTPDVMKLYSMVPGDMKTTLEEMRKNRPVRIHSARFGEYVDKLLKAIDSPSLFQETIDHLGSAHVRLGVEPKHLEVFGEILFDVIEIIMKCNVSCELMQVWKTFGISVQNNIIASMKTVG